MKAEVSRPNGCWHRDPGEFDVHASATAQHAISSLPYANHEQTTDRRVSLRAKRDASRNGSAAVPFEARFARKWSLRPVRACQPLKLNRDLTGKGDAARSFIKEACLRHYAGGMLITPSLPKKRNSLTAPMAPRSRTALVQVPWKCCLSVRVAELIGIGILLALEIGRSHGCSLNDPPPSLCIRGFGVKRLGEQLYAQPRLSRPPVPCEGFPRRLGG